MEQSEMESLVRRLVISKVSREKISRRVGLSPVELEELIRRLWGGARQRSVAVDPTPEEIASRCAEIRERWSDWEYSVRSGQTTWREAREPPQVSWRGDHFQTG